MDLLDGCMPRTSEAVLDQEEVSSVVVLFFWTRGEAGLSG